MVEIINLTKKYGKLTVLNKINLTIPKFKVSAILGPNGSGKTTLIKSILGLIRINEGKILFDGVDIQNVFTYRQKIGYMPQIGNYPQNLTSQELIKLILDLRFGKGKSTSPNFLIDYFELAPHLNKFIRTLSGGTIQKLSVILALMSDAEVYILDEPTSGLDPISVSKLKNLIKQEQEKGKTFIVVTHQLNDVQAITEHLFFLLEGKLIIDQPVQNFIDQMNEIDLESAIFKFIIEKGKADGTNLGKQNIV
ncbi:MAG: ABC transporter ATP-binding protein [Candidatus Kapaibacteriales bacterium]